MNAVVCCDRDTFLGQWVGHRGQAWTHHHEVRPTSGQHNLPKNQGYYMGEWKGTINKIHQLTIFSLNTNFVCFFINYDRTLGWEFRDLGSNPMYNIYLILFDKKLDHVTSVKSVDWVVQSTDLRGSLKNLWFYERMIFKPLHFISNCSSHALVWCLTNIY